LTTRRNYAINQIDGTATVDLGAPGFTLRVLTFSKATGFITAPAVPLTNAGVPVRTWLQLVKIALEWNEEMVRGLGVVRPAMRGHTLTISNPLIGVQNFEVTINGAIVVPASLNVLTGLATFFPRPAISMNVSEHHFVASAQVQWLEYLVNTAP
jgi:hypothetical protein